MTQSYRMDEKPYENYASWMVGVDPMPVIDEMSERMGLGSLPDLFKAFAELQTEAIRIAIHAPFLPFRIYSNAFHIKTPLSEMIGSTEMAVSSIADAMNQNSEILQQETGKLVEPIVSQKSASPKAMTSSGPTAASGT